MSLSSVRLSEGIITQNAGHEHCISGPSVFTAIRSNMEGRFEDMRHVFAIMMVKILHVLSRTHLGNPTRERNGYRVQDGQLEGTFIPAWTVDPANPVARWQQFSKF